MCGFATAPPADADVITGTPNVQNPHKSFHVPGTVNVVVTVACTAPVTQIRITAGLYRDGVLVALSPSTPFSSTNLAQANAATYCQDGTYQGWMDYGVTWPPGLTRPARAMARPSPSPAQMILPLLIVKRRLAARPIGPRAEGPKEWTTRQQQSRVWRRRPRRRVGSRENPQM